MTVRCLASYLSPSITSLLVHAARVLTSFKVPRLLAYNKQELAAYTYLIVGILPSLFSMKQFLQVAM